MNKISNKHLLIIFFCNCCISLSGCSTKIDYAKAEQYIKESERQWAESVATGDTAVVKRILANDFIGIAPDGSYYNKQDQIDMAPDGPKYFLSNHLNNIKIRFYDKAAIAQGDEIWVKHLGNKITDTGHFVWTDTWILLDGKWQIVAAEDVIVPLK